MVGSNSRKSRTRCRGAPPQFPHCSRTPRPRCAATAVHTTAAAHTAAPPAPPLSNTTRTAAAAVPVHTSAAPACVSAAQRRRRRSCALHSRCCTRARTCTKIHTDMGESCKMTLRFSDCALGSHSGESRVFNLADLQRTQLPRARLNRRHTRSRHAPVAPPAGTRSPCPAAARLPLASRHTGGTGASHFFQGIKGVGPVPHVMSRVGCLPRSTLS